MNFTVEEKTRIFSIINENFWWCSRETIDDEGFYSAFENRVDSEKFFVDNGAVKYCIFSSLFEDYVVKFCPERFDYCEREYTNYLAAVEHKLEAFFPCTDFLGEINGMNFYLQEKAYCDPESVSDILYETLRENWECDEETSECQIAEEIICAIDNLEDDECVQMLYNTEELLEFLCDYCINDLHPGNFGYIDDRLVIIDFSGYGYRATERSF